MALTTILDNRVINVNGFCVLPDFPEDGFCDLQYGDTYIYKGPGYGDGLCNFGAQSTNCDNLEAQAIAVAGIQYNCIGAGWLKVDINNIPPQVDYQVIGAGLPTIYNCCGQHNTTVRAHCYHLGYQLNATTWYYPTRDVKIVTVYLLSCSTTPISDPLPGTSFDPVTLSWVVDDGYSWDPEREMYVSDCADFCISTEYNNSSVCNGDKEFKIILDSPPAECQKEIDFKLYLNYREIYTDGKNSEDRFSYYGPRIIEFKNINEINFYVNHIRSNGREGRIEINYQSDDPDFIVCSYPTIDIICGESQASTCCDHVPKDYKLWVPTNECSRFEQKKHITALPSKMKVK